MSQSPSEPVSRPQADLAEQARKLFAQPCDFLRAVASAEQFPPSKMPEIAFIGRSNVGKSSLVNGLTGRKKLARTSNTPGRTQQIVFFDLAHRLMLVDLPGYGHAKAPLEEKAKWEDLTQLYFQTRPPLKCVCLLLDGRHGALANDLVMMKVLDRAAVSTQIILTKADHVPDKDRVPRTAEVRAAFAKNPAARPDILWTSAEKGAGMQEVREFLYGFVAQDRGV